MRVATVVIEHPDTPGATMIINEADFDPALHRLVGGETTADPSGSAEPHAASVDGAGEAENPDPSVEDEAQSESADAGAAPGPSGAPAAPVLDTPRRGRGK